MVVGQISLEPPQDTAGDVTRDGRVNVLDLLRELQHLVGLRPSLTRCSPFFPPSNLDLVAASDLGSSDTDNITNDATPEIALVAEPGATVRLFATDALVAQGVADGSATLISALLADGVNVITARAEDPDGNVSDVSQPLELVIDTTPPSLTLDAPLTGGQYTSKAPLTGSTADSASGLQAARFSRDGQPFAPLAAGLDGRFDLPMATRSLAAGTHQLEVEVSDIAGNLSQVTVDFSVAQDFIAGADGTEGWGGIAGDSAQLEERDSFLVPVPVPVDLGGAGSRTLRFELEAQFDSASRASATGDRFLVYMVDPANQSQTLLDQGEAGTAVFSVGENGAEFAPGMVRYDGLVVEIDLTSLPALSAGLFVFQILNGDEDTGSKVRVHSLSNVLDPTGTASPVFPRQRGLAAPGEELDLPTLSVTQDVEVVVENVRFNPSNGRYTAGIRVCNLGAAIGWQVALVFPGLPVGVELLSPSGVDASGSPYINLEDAIGAGGLSKGAISGPVLIEIDNPGLQRFSLIPTVLAGGPNRAPVFDPVGPLTAMPGGDLEVSLSATDPDSDPVFFSIRNEGPLPNGRLESDGTLVFNPAARPGRNLQLYSGGQRWCPRSNPSGYPRSGSRSSDHHPPLRSDPEHS